MTQDSYSHSRLIFKHAAVLGVFATLVVACKGGGRDGISATSLDPPAEPDPPGDVPGFPLADHVAQANITNGNIQFQELFVLGDELFEAKYNAQDGVGIL